MLKTTTAIAAAILLTSPLSAVEEGTQPAELEVGICVTSTQFFARNFSSVDQVLLFKGGGVLAWRTLAPGCDLTWSYPTQLLEDISLEVGSWTGGAWHRTGTHQLESVAASGVDALWVQGDSARTSWFEIGASLFVEPTGASIFPSTLPSSTSAGSTGDQTLMAPTHIPVITPTDQPDGDVPPVIEERPLPPF